MNITKIFCSLLLMGTVFTAAAQNGIVRGKVIDDATGEELYGVTVVVAGTTTGSITDFEGAFEISLAPGSYDLQFSFVSFKTITISGVEILSGEVTNFNTIRMKEAVEELAEVVVTAEVIRDSEAALYTIKKKSANVLDGISAQNFRKIGDSNAASAMKRVTGVSVEGGKYVYVRGLGDRYTKSTLNGVDVPGLDPDRNTLQMDIFPTNIIDNIVVAKSFTADLPADFTGGVVNIQTKDFPEEKTFKLSGSLGFNPAMHFNNEYLTYEGGSTDWLGFDNGTREIPTTGYENIPSRVDALGNAQDAAVYEDILGGFNSNLAAMQQTSFMDYSIGANYGNQLSLNNGKLGYFASLSYKNSTDFYQDVVYGRYGLDQQDLSNTELDQREYQSGDYGSNSVLIGALGGLAYKTDRSKYRLSLLHLQNGESTAGTFDYIGSDQGSNFDAIQHNLEYSQRSLTNVLINGIHTNSTGSFEVEWKVSPTRSSIDDPDIRFTRIRTDNTGFQIGTESGLPERIWRTLEEVNLASNVAASMDYFVSGKDAKFKFGGAHTYKQRDYNIENFQTPTNNVNITEDADAILSEDNLWSTTNLTGVYFDPQFIPNNPNKYDATINNTAAFVSNEMFVADKLKTVVGLRMEKYTQTYTGSNQQREQFNDLKVIDDLDLFPTANLIYSLNENQNLRGSYSSTIARPSFKEASFATIVDPITGRTFIGGFSEDIDASTGEVLWDGDLRATRINNYDLRWEMFMNGGQTISVSAFYKSLDAPIEIVQYSQATNNFQPRNVGNGQLFGVELELRKNLDFLGELFEEFTFSSNVTIVDSEIEMSETEYQSRLTNAREGQTISTTRDMAGQAPYIVNLGLAYEGFENGWEAGVYYNVQGETLHIVGIVDRPDIYTVPFHSLNLNANKSFGPDNRMKIGFKIDNLLGDDREKMFQSFNTADQLFTRLSPGTSVSVRFGYKF